MLILAGRGKLPGLARRQAEAEGAEVRTIALTPGVKGDYQPPLEKLPQLMLSLKKEGYRRVVLIGGLPRRRTTETLAKNRNIADFLGGKSKGDDQLLRKTVRYMRLNGFKPIKSSETFAPLLAKAGAIGGKKPDKAARAGIELAAKALRRLGPFDVGQAAVIQGENILALEGGEGTDEMLKRGAGLAWKNGPPLILVKAAKPRQSRYADLPAIGSDTVKLAAGLKFTGIAVEAGQTLLIDKKRLQIEADAKGLFLWGFKSKRYLF